jgi:hypothetical protein
VYQGYGKPNMTNIAEFGTANSTPTLYFLPNSTEGSEPSVAHEREVKNSFTVPRGVDLRATLVWTDPPGSIRATTQLQHDLDLTVQIRNSNQTFHPLTASNSTQRDERTNVEMVQVSYAQLLAAAQSEANSGELIGTDGEIIVDAVIYGRSVLLAKTQAFAFVASSSVIGTAIGAAATDNNNIGSDSIWTPYMVAGVAVGAIVLLMLIACIVRCCARRGRRHETPRTPGAAAAAGYPGGAVIVGQQPIANQPYYAHSTPAGGVQQPYDAERCPYCLFATPDAVAMVNHVEAMHSDGNMQQAPEGTNFGLPPNVYPPLPPPGPQYHNYDPRLNTMQREDERCPYCTFVSSDPVILVNHVQHIHGQ